MCHRFDGGISAVLLIQSLQSLLGDRTGWTNMTDSKAQSTISRLTITVAVFGAVCNLLCWGLSTYQHFYVQREPIWDPASIIGQCFLLAPLLALFVFRRFAPVVSLYAVALLSNLALQIAQFGRIQKIDMADLLLAFLGAISIAVILVWATIRWVISIRNAPKGRGAD